MVPVIAQSGEMLMNFICVDNGKFVTDVRLMGIGEAVDVWPHL